MHISLRRGAALLPLLAIVAFVALAGQVRDTQAGLASYALDDTAPFAWMDISGTGTNLTSLSTCDDCYESDVAIGFTFNFAGTDYTVLEPTTNGIVSLDQEASSEYSNEPLPTTYWVGAALFPFWDDLDPGVEGDIYVDTVGTAPNRAFIVQYHQITSYDQSNGYLATFQVALCEGSNNVVFQYLDTVFNKPSYPEHDNGGDATIGIQESDTSALQYSHNSPVLSDNMAIVLYPTSGSPTNCLAGPPPPTNTPPPVVPTDTPVAPQPTATVAATVAADVTLPQTGAGAQGAGGPTGWLIAALLGSAALAAVGYGALRLRRA